MKAEGKYAEIALRYRLNAYHLTIARYYELLAAQDGKCPGCGANTDLQIDHDHACCPEDSVSCGKCVRGLLCGPCNTFLGRIEESPERHSALLKYKEHHANPE